MIGLKLLIVGGGIAGLSCAIALRKGGHEVHVVEVEKSWQTTSTGITLQSHTYLALSKVGVLEEVKAFGFHGRGSRVRRADGAILGEILGQTPDTDLPGGGGIMRPLLQGILARKARESGARISLGTTLSQFELRPEDVRVGFSDGKVESYDLIVGADGVYSKLRSVIFPDAPPPRFTGQSSFRVVAPRPHDVDMIDIYLGNPIKAGVTPASQDELFMWTLSPEQGDEYFPKERQIARLQEVLKGFGGVIGEIRDSLGPWSSIIYRPLHALMLAKPWHMDRVVLIGDAAHATTPHLSSGASAALEDAILLTEYLSQAASIEEALIDFTDRRFERCRFIVETSLRIGELELAGVAASEQERVYKEGLRVLAEPA